MGVVVDGVLSWFVVLPREAVGAAVPPGVLGKSIQRSKASRSVFFEDKQRIQYRIVIVADLPHKHKKSPSGIILCIPCDATRSDWSFIAE